MHNLSIFLDTKDKGKIRAKDKALDYFKVFDLMHNKMLLGLAKMSYLAIG